MNRPKFNPIFTKKSDYCEKSSKTPVETFVPHQALNLAELIQRFERGQRLNVHCNFAPGSNLMNCTDEQAFEMMKADDMEHGFPPTDVHDICDVEREYSAHKQHKQEFAERMKAKKSAKGKETKEAPKEAPEDSELKN